MVATGTANPAACSRIQQQVRRRRTAAHDAVAARRREPGLQRADDRLLRLLRVVDEVAARSVRTEASGVKGATEFRLVLGVSRQIAQLVHAVRELTLVAVLAAAALLKRPAQLRLVAAGVGLVRTRLVRRLADAAAEFAMIRFAVQEDVVDAERDADSQMQALVVVRQEGRLRPDAGRMLAEGKGGVLPFERRPELDGFRRLDWLQRGSLRMGHRMRNGSERRTGTERREEEHH